MKGPLYVIVRFELKKGELEILAPLVREFFEKEVSTMPGFISAKLHTNEDETVLINYATWESSEKFLKFMEEFARVSEISKKIQAFNPKTDRVYEIPL